MQIHSQPYSIKLFLTISCIVFFLHTDTSYAQDLLNTTPEQEEVEEPSFPEDSLGRRTPRGTISGFISAVGDKNYSRASRYFNLNDIINVDYNAEELSQLLERLLDQGGNILPYTRISDEYSGRADDNLPPEVDLVGYLNAEGERIDLLLEATQDEQGAPIWLFTSQTVHSISEVTAAEVLFIERIMPDFLQQNLIAGVPLGQWLVVLLLAALAYLLAWAIISAIIFLLRLVWHKARTEPTKGIIKAFALPFKLYLAVWLFVISSQELGLSIILRQRFSSVTIIIGIVAILILLWNLTDFISNFSKRKMTLSGNASGVSVVLFLRRAAKISVIIFGFIAILGVIGVNVTAGLAALGIGGIALALGAQKTIENFVGSVTLITDQPIRVGDFCTVGDTTGTIEKIGMRSTQIRTLARTIVTIPNGEFSAATIENYAHRDRFLFQHNIDLRYETTPDQVRFLLVEIRSLLYAHPMVNPDPARIRFIEFASASLTLEIFSYINAVNFDEFLEVKEDILLRIMDIVAESGTDFAFPSQTLYFAKDKGLSKEKSKNAEDCVKDWKSHNEMPLPSFDENKINQIKNSIDYPPEGSVKRNQKN